MHPALPSKTLRRALRFFLLGLLFEISLLVFDCLLPENSWFGSEFSHDLFAIHRPLLSLFDFSPLAPLWVISPMAILWAFLFYLVSCFKSFLFSEVLVSTRQRGIVAGLLGMAAIVTLAAAVASALPQNPRPFANSPEVIAVVDANTAFAIDLYQRLRKRPGNLFFSPYSISAALAMTSAGARGRTELEMIKSLHFSSGQAHIQDAFRQLTGRVIQVQRRNRISLLIANSLWLQQDYPLSNSFLNLIRKDYQADVQGVNFSRSPETVRNEINSWVERKTSGRIQNLFEPGRLSSLTRLVLCNAIYFKGQWQTQFNLSRTKMEPFSVTSNEAVTVPMMSQLADFKTTLCNIDVGNNLLWVQLLELPYIGNDLSMVILLPETENGQDSLSDLEDELTPDNLRTCLAQMDRANPKKTFVSIPRFTMDQRSEVSEQLKSMGMTSAFGDTANFSGMDGATNLFISEIAQRASIEVNEEGTEAAASTWVHIETMGMAERFIADHPFVFLIRDNATGAILFIGRVIDPAG